MPIYTITTTSSQTMPHTRVLEIIRAKYPKIPPFASIRGNYEGRTGTEPVLVAVEALWADPSDSEHRVKFTVKELAELLKIDGFDFNENTRFGSSQLAAVSMKSTAGVLE